MNDVTPAPETRIAVRPGYQLVLTDGAREPQVPVAVLDATAVFILAGSATIRVDRQSRTFGAPAVSIAPPGSEFDIESAFDAEVLVVTLKPSVLVECADRLGFDERGTVVLTPVAEPLAGALELSARRLALAIRAAATGREATLDLAVDGLATDLVDSYGRSVRSPRLEMSRAGLVDRRLRRSIEFMHDNFGRDIPLADIAAAGFLSEFHFARLFKRITGQTPHAYLASVRVEKAKVLLAESDLTVAEVGERVGYQSASHFGKVFRQATGITPTAFREAAVR